MWVIVVFLRWTAFYKLSLGGRNKAPDRGALFLLS